MSILGIRIVNLLLFTLSCFLMANIVNQVGAFGLIPAESPASRPPPPAVNTTRPWSEREQILNRNLFGAQVVQEELIPEPEPEEELTKTSLPVRLLGTIASEDQFVASAAIENTQDRGHQVVRVGHALDKFPNVLVSRIDRGRVILQNGTRREELLLDPKAPKTATVATSRRAQPRSRRRGPASAEASIEARLGKLADRAPSRGPTSILNGARILPKKDKSGNMLGIELNQIKSDSLFEKVGLVNGDVITSINGLTIDDPSAQAELLSAFTQADEIVAEVTSANGTKRQIKADAELIGSMMSGGQ